MDNIAEKLAAPFPKEVVSWRAQQVTNDGTKALALAYIDSRDVMNRLDDVCGVGGWQCEYPHANGKTICSIGIKIDGEWVWKADGAGDTDIEAEKGAISDAFKRAAVKWGIGRYLYDLEAVWVRCESYKQGDRFKWKSFKEDPWAEVARKDVSRKVYTTSNAAIERARAIEADLLGASSLDEMKAIWRANQTHIKAISSSDGGPEWLDHLERVKAKRLREIEDRNALQASYGKDFMDINGGLSHEQA